MDARALRRLLVAVCALLALAGALPAHAAGLANIRLFGYDSKAQEVVLYSDAPLSPQTFRLDAPERYVVDLPNSRYAGATQTLQAIAGTPIKAVRISQFKAGVVRLVFDLSDRAAFNPSLQQVRPGSYKLSLPVIAAASTPAPRTARASDDRARARAAKTPAAPAEPVSDLGPGSSGLSLKRVRGGWQLIVSAKTPFSYAVVQKKRADRLVFDLTGAGTDLPKDSLYVDNGLIARVRALALSDHATRLIIEFDQALHYALRQSDTKRTLVISLGNAVAGDTQEVTSPQRNPNQHRVTIDPGHGGSDPGTEGVEGTLEKDVTLQVAMRLQKLMQDSGMEVQMTRTKDMQILLHPRVDVGDAFDSDVFISIHANHIDDPHVAGIETYYFTPKSLTLARAVHHRMVTLLQRPDRGVRRNNFVVVKYNKMPACLVEIGYLSNPQEERMLTNPQYQQRTAEAILAGVQDYFRSRAIKQ